MRTVATAVLLLGAAGCSGSSGASDPVPVDPTEPTATTSPVELAWSAEVTGEHEANGNYRQGLARSGDGWIFVTNNAIYRTDDDLVEVEAHTEAIPPELAEEGYDHLGDPDVHDGLIWIPVERPDKDQAEQVTARYREDTLEFVDSFTVAQHHNAFVAVADDGTIYSADEFSDDAITRSTLSDDEELVATQPLELSQLVDRIQGGDVADGALWLSTDDDHNGVYRVDLETGEVTDLGSMGHVDGEGEGIDATDLPSGLLHALVADEAIAPMWVVDLAVTSTPEG